MQGKMGIKYKQWYLTDEAIISDEYFQHNEDRIGSQAVDYYYKETERLRRLLEAEHGKGLDYINSLGRKLENIISGITKNRKNSKLYNQNVQNALNLVNQMKRRFNPKKSFER